MIIWVVLHAQLLLDRVHKAKSAALGIFGDRFRILARLACPPSSLAGPIRPPPSGDKTLTVVVVDFTKAS